MQKMTRNLIILGVLVVLAVGGFFILPNLGKPAPTASAEPTASQPAEDVTLSNYTTDDVVQVDVQNNAGAPYTLLKTTVQKDGKDTTVYVIKGQESLAIDQAEALARVSSVGSVIGDRLIEANAADLSVYGLDNPAATITATYADGKTQTFLVGNRAPSGNTYYFMKKGDPRVITVWQNVGAEFTSIADTMLQKKTIDISSDDITHVTILKGGKDYMELAYAPEEEVSISNWKMIKPWPRYVDVSSSPGQDQDAYFTTFLKGAVGITLGDVVAANPTDLAQYGLDNPTTVIRVAGKDNKSFELQVGKDVTDSAVYARFADSPVVYTVDKTYLAFADTTPFRLVDKTIQLVNIASTLGLEVKGLGADTMLKIEQVPTLDDQGVQKKDGNGNPMFDQKFTVDGTAVDDKVARYYYQIAIGLQSFSTVKEGWQPAGDPVLTLTYTRNSDPTTVALAFYDYDTNFYAVQANGETIFTIKKEKIAELADAAQKLKAGTLTVPAS